MIAGLKNPAQRRNRHRERESHRRCRQRDERKERGRPPALAIEHHAPSLRHLACGVLLDTEPVGGLARNGKNYHALDLWHYGRSASRSISRSAPRCWRTGSSMGMIRLLWGGCCIFMMSASRSEERRVGKECGRTVRSRL